MAKLSDNVGDWTDKMLTNFIFTTMQSWKNEYVDQEWETFKRGVAKVIADREAELRIAQRDLDNMKRDNRAIKAQVEKLQEEIERLKAELARAES